MENGGDDDLDAFLGYWCIGNLTPHREYLKKVKETFAQHWDMIADTKKIRCGRNVKTLKKYN